MIGNFQFVNKKWTVQNKNSFENNKSIITQCNEKLTSYTHILTRKICL